MRKRSLSMVALVTLAIAVFTASVAVAGTAGSNGNSLTADAKVKPKKLSKAALTPATLEIATKTTTNDATGALNPAVRAVMDFDKNGKYVTKGLPTCGDKKLTGKRPPEALQACKKAMIGTGNASVLAAFFGQATQMVKATLTVFNGVPKGGKPTVLFYAYAQQPTENAFVFTGVVSKYRKKGFGSRFQIEFPKLFGGNGALREFNIKIQKKFRYKGKKRSLVSAKCPSSKKLKSNIAFTYQDGETLSVPSKQTCKR